MEFTYEKNRTKNYLSKISIRWTLLIYDAAIFTVVLAFALIPEMSKAAVPYGWLDILWHYLIGLSAVLFSRLVFHVYGQIWRYGEIGAFLRLNGADLLALCLYFFAQLLIPGVHTLHPFIILSIVAINLVVCLGLRMIYRYLYKRLNRRTKLGLMMTKVINFVGHCDWSYDEGTNENKIKIAILGAGRLGTSLAEELINNPINTESRFSLCFNFLIDNTKNLILNFKIKVFEW